MADDRYNTRLDNNLSSPSASDNNWAVQLRYDKYGSSRVIDIPAEVAEHVPWFNQTLTQVNDSVVRLGFPVTPMGDR